MRDLDAFLLGYKPALLETTFSESFVSILPKLINNYPYITEGIRLRNDADYYLFFQTKEQKISFLTHLQNVKPLSPEFHKLLGLTLGYPP